MLDQNGARKFGVLHMYVEWLGQLAWHKVQFAMGAKASFGARPARRASRTNVPPSRKDLPVHQKVHRRWPASKALRSAGGGRRASMTSLMAGIAIGSAALSFASEGCAGESPFGWIYTADVHPQGTSEFEHKSFLQQGQSRGQYSYVQHKEEIEYGLTDKLQIAGYFNWSYANAFQNGIDGTTGGPGVNQYLAPAFDPYSRYRGTRFDSISFEAIYQVMNPLTDPFGLALYVEPSFGPLTRELEWRIILQKNFLDDRLIVAMNILGQHEHNIYLDGTVERASPLDLTFGVSYLFMPNWTVGLETRIHNEFTGYFFNSPDHSAFFAGPVLHYATKEYWWTVAWRHQLPIVNTYNEDQAAVAYKGRIYGNEHARDEVMFRLGVPLGAGEGQHP